MVIEILRYNLALFIALGVIFLPIILDVIALDIADNILNKKYNK